MSSKAARRKAVEPVPQQRRGGLSYAGERRESLTELMQRLTAGARDEIFEAVAEAFRARTKGGGGS